MLCLVDIFPCAALQLCFSFWLQSNCGWIAEEQRSLWPLPVQPQMQCVDVHLRSIPWFSFNFPSTVQGLSNSYHGMLDKYCSELLENALQTSLSGQRCHKKPVQFMFSWMSQKVAEILM
jgi:hypothetical protein